MKYNDIYEFETFRFCDEYNEEQSIFYKRSGGIVICECEVSHHKQGKYERGLFLKGLEYISSGKMFNIYLKSYDDFINLMNLDKFLFELEWKYSEKKVRKYFG